MRRRSTSLVLTVLLILAAAPGVRAQDRSSAQSIPAGYGTLNQDDIAVRIRTDDVELRLIPLDERVLRLLATDAYTSLRSLMAAKRPSIDSVASQSGVTRPGLALVSFFGQRADARFDPQIVTIGIRNRVFRPLGIVPLSASFSSQQLGVRVQASGIYIFEEEIPVTEPFSVGYGTFTANDWERRLSTLDRERQRIASRARAGGPSDSTVSRR